MLVRFGRQDLGDDWPGSVACIGTFDGVHLGHQAVIGTMVAEAARREKPGVVVTFDRHPFEVLAPQSVPPSVGTLDSNLEEFERLGVSLTIVLPFDRALAATSAEDFLSDVLEKSLRVEFAAVGHDFAFGKGRQGNPTWLQARLPTAIVPPLEVDGSRVSSSRVRAAIAEGEVQTASRLLGRPWQQEGVVASGQKLGRTLGFPTLNLAGTGRQVVPADGVYAGVAQTRCGRFKAAIGVGMRPTVGGGPRTIEAHLIDYPGEGLYGSAVRLAYLRRLREDRKFDTLEELKAQMARDVAEVAALEYSEP